MSSPETPTRGYTQDKAAYARRLKRIEGQVRGVQRMIDEDTYCIDVLTQISAIQSALKSVSLGLMEEHLGHCVKHAVEADPVDLIETLAQRLADVCLRDRRVEWVRITVHKPDAPIEANFGDVTLTITRSRPN